MTTRQALIERIARELGHKPTAIRQWRSRGWVPHPHRFPLARRAAWEGVTLVENDFDSFGTALDKKDTAA